SSISSCERCSADGISASLFHRRNVAFSGYFVEVTGKAGVKTRYLHLNKILVTKGARVTRGGAIALSGNSGRSSGPHLHYELVINNNPVNSLAFRAAAPADNKLEQHAFAHARDYERYLD
ncbi:TPA: peptidoglycan DD-metalloendopeptidase family protein, partial [Salmonella enterica subsp. enterica serovar Typhimurium]